MPGVVAVLTFQDIVPYARTIPIRLYPLPGLERFCQYCLARQGALCRRAHRRGRGHQPVYC